MRGRKEVALAGETLQSSVERLKEIGCLRLGAILTVSACLGCVVLLCAGQLAVAQANPMNQVTVCVGMVTIGRTQVGMWWQSLFMSRLLLATTSPYTWCFDTPWPPMFPLLGEIAFPP